MKRILLVDDSRVARRMVKKRMPESDDVAIVEAVDGVQAVALYKELSPELVLMDLTMDDGNGFEAIENIILHDGEAKIVVLSADIQPRARQRCIELGALECVPKPITTDTCVRLLTTYVQASS